MKTIKTAEEMKTIFEQIIEQSEFLRNGEISQSTFNIALGAILNSKFTPSVGDAKG